LGDIGPQEFDASLLQNDIDDCIEPSAGVDGSNIGDDDKLGERHGGAA
jgi:hypothetical protein